MPRHAQLQNATSFLVSRGVNAALILIQLALVGRFFDASDASRFFVLWTVVLAVSTGLRFGFDHIMPKRAAAANVSGSVARLAEYRQVAGRALPLVSLATVPVLLVVLPDSSAS